MAPGISERKLGVLSVPVRRNLQRIVYRVGALLDLSDVGIADVWPVRIGRTGAASHGQILRRNSAYRLAVNYACHVRRPSAVNRVALCGREGLPVLEGIVGHRLELVDIPLPG